MLATDNMISQLTGLAGSLRAANNSTCESGPNRLPLTLTIVEPFKAQYIQHCSDRKAITSSLVLTFENLGVELLVLSYLACLCAAG